MRKIDDRLISLSKDWLHIHFPYDPVLIAVVRQLPDRRWDSSNRVWKVPATSWHVQRVMDTLGHLGFTISPAVYRAAQGTGGHRTRKGLPGGLYPFQREAVEFIVNANGRCIVADEMGTGKTIEALAYLNTVNFSRALVVCPANVVYKWEAEVSRWLPNNTVQVVTKGKDSLEDVDVHIMSYAIAVKQFSNLELQKYQAIISDECHYLKNPKAARTRTVKRLARAVDFLLFLSGTPFLNRPSELFPVLNMIDPVGYGNFYNFCARYCGAFYDGMWVFPPNVLTNRDELADRLSSVMIRRTKREVLDQLPELTRSIVPVFIPNMAEYKRAVKDVRAWVRENKKTLLNPEHALTKLNILRQVVGKGKIDAAIELAETILDDEEKKVVIFAHHKDVVSKLVDALKPYGVRTITGSVSQKERQENSNLFLMQDNKIRVMIISTAGAEGIDLYSASDIIFCEREWTPAKEEQAEARLHRIGQRNNVTAHYLVAKGTVDEKLDKVVAEKRKIIGQVVRQDEVLTEILKELEA